MLVDRTLNDLVNDTHTDEPTLTVIVIILHILPRGADVNSLPVPRHTDILAAIFDFFKLSTFCFAAPQITLYDEPRTIFNQDAKVLFSVIAGIHSNQELFIHHLVTQVERFFQKIRRNSGVLYV